MKIRQREIQDVVVLDVTVLGLRNAQGQQRNATAAEAKAYLIAHMRQIVVAYEDRIANEALPAPADFTPS